MEQIEIDRPLTAQEVGGHTNPLALYDRYGSMAYGVILQIIPEPRLAQVVLVDLFAAPHVTSAVEHSAHPAGEIIRLARAKALKAKSPPADGHVPLPGSDKNYPTEKLVFDLSFCQGYSVDVIAENFQLSRASVLKSIFAYVKQLRLS